MLALTLMSGASASYVFGLITSESGTPSILALAGALLLGVLGLAAFGWMMYRISFVVYNLSRINRLKAAAYSKLLRETEFAEQ